MEKRYKENGDAEEKLPISDKEYKGNDSQKAIKNSDGTYIIKGYNRQKPFKQYEEATLYPFFNRDTNELSLLKNHPFIEIKGLIKKLQLPCASFLTPWHELDDQLVKIAYKDGGSKITVRFSEEHLAVSKLKLLGRESYSIRHRAMELGLIEEIIGESRANTIWSNYEISILKQQYPKKGCNIAELLDLGRTQSAIETKATSMGLIYKGTM